MIRSERPITYGMDLKIWFCWLLAVTNYSCVGRLGHYVDSASVGLAINWLIISGGYPAWDGVLAGVAWMTIFEEVADSEDWADGWATYWLFCS